VSLFVKNLTEIRVLIKGLAGVIEGRTSVMLNWGELARAKSSKYL